MKNLFYLIIFFILISCANNKNTYWCGDHPCINKKERESYFKKTMIVEIKKIRKDTSKDNSTVEKIIQQAKEDEKRRIKAEKSLAKEAKLEEKRRIKAEKSLAKEIKLEEKRRIKAEKSLAKEVKLEEKRRIKAEKSLAKEVKRDEKKITKKENIYSKQGADSVTDIENISINVSNFKKLVEKITKRNSLRPYPDINDIPN